MEKSHKTLKKIVDFSSPDSEEIYSNLYNSLQKRKYDQNLIKKLNLEKGFYSNPITPAFIWEMYSKPPSYNLNSIRMLHLFPFLKPLFRKLIYILWRVDTALNKNRHQAFYLLLNKLVEKNNKEKTNE